MNGKMYCIKLLNQQILHARDAVDVDRPRAPGPPRPWYTGTRLSPSFSARVQRSRNNCARARARGGAWERGYHAPCATELLSAMDSSTLNSSAMDSSVMDSSAIGTVGVAVLVGKCMQVPCSAVPDIRSIR